MPGQEPRPPGRRPSEREAAEKIAEAAAEARACPDPAELASAGTGEPDAVSLRRLHAARAERHLSDRRTMATRISPLAESPERGSAPGQPAAEGWPQRYRIRGRLRRTSGRPVLLAVDRTDGRLVLIKGGAGSGGAQHEAEILAQLAHPNIVALRDRIERAGASYLVLDYIDASSLEDHLAEQGGRLQPAPLTRLLLELCDALSHVHAQGLLHRDLKPANILVRAEGTPVLVDFSAALPMDDGAAPREFSSLTEGYAAPEQYAEDQAEGPWTDVYGLGALAYRAFTGELPKAAPERLRGQAMPPAAAHAGAESAQLAAAIDWALALDPAARPQSIEEWRQALAGGAPRPGPAAGPEEPDDGAPTIRVRRVKARRLIAPADAAVEALPPGRRRTRQSSARDCSCSAASRPRP